MTFSTISSPTHPSLVELARSLREHSGELRGELAWPSIQLSLCGKFGVFEWFVGESAGGQGWNDPDIFRGYLELSAACLTTTFVITQRTGASRRIEAGESDAARTRYLADLVTGACFATVGISHLTTSRRHLSKPVLRAEEVPGGFRLDGFCPWVTGGPHADVVVLGATLADSRQILVALPMDSQGITIAEPARLVGLSASQTGPVELDRVVVERKWLVAGPVEGVMGNGSGGNTGGLQTSTLALGLAHAAIAFLEQESSSRGELVPPATAFRDEWSRLREDLLQLAGGAPVCSNASLRTQANSLVLRCTQAALAAAKGTGYLVDHPAGRWCQEALFFLVWSCPQPVMNANVCELAGIE